MRSCSPKLHLTDSLACRQPKLPHIPTATHINPHRPHAHHDSYVLRRAHCVRFCRYSKPHKLTVFVIYNCDVFRSRQHTRASMHTSRTRHVIIDVRTHTPTNPLRIQHTHLHSIVCIITFTAAALVNEQYVNGFTKTHQVAVASPRRNTILAAFSHSADCIPAFCEHVRNPINTVTTVCTSHEAEWRHWHRPGHMLSGPNRSFVQCAAHSRTYHARTTNGPRADDRFTS